MTTHEIRTRHRPDPIERWLPLCWRIGVTLLASLLLYEAAASTWSFPPGTPPFFFGQWSWWIITPLHEGGHFLFFFFGRTLYILGGSFWQVMFPVLLAAVALRKGSFWGTVYLIIAGVHLLHLNPYIYDAPYRSLPLLGGKRVGHDWYNLLIHWQALDMAEWLSHVAYYSGMLVGSAGVISGIAWSVYRFYHPPDLAPIPDTPTAQTEKGGRRRRFGH